MSEAGMERYRDALEAGLSRREAGLFAAGLDVTTFLTKWCGKTPAERRQARIKLFAGELERLNGKYTVHGTLARDNRFLDVHREEQGFAIRYGDELWRERSAVKKGKLVARFDTLPEVIDYLYSAEETI